VRGLATKIATWTQKTPEAMPTNLCRHGSGKTLRNLRAFGLKRARRVGEAAPPYPLGDTWRAAPSAGQLRLAPARSRTRDDQRGRGGHSALRREARLLEQHAAELVLCDLLAGSHEQADGLRLEAGIV